MRRKYRNSHSPLSVTFFLLPAVIIILFSLWTALPIIEFTHPGAVNRVSLTFIGDIMGHGSQIRGAWDDSTKSYSYHGVFKQIKDIISEADIAVANLELTLGGEPYTSYPEFSSPDALVVACQSAGIDCLVLANNHAADRGKKGIERTIRVIDSCGMDHAGVFADLPDKNENNPLYIKRNNIKIALLNYTYSVNGSMPAPPASINIIDRLLIKTDIDKALKDSSDIIITYLHFGSEYHRSPDSSQINLVKFLFESGSTIVIGSHPHVIQPLYYFPAEESAPSTFVAYSLGNFVSGQNREGTDGGLMLTFDIIKDKAGTRISNPGYYLTWVNKKYNSGKVEYSVIPCSMFEEDTIYLDSFSKQKMARFISNTRELLANTGIRELGLNSMHK